MKKSKENNKIKPSINLIALILLVLSVSIVIINLDVVSGNFISAWLFENNPFPKLVMSQESMDVTLTAILFSVIAFSISKLINQWKETAKFRKAKKQMRVREKVLCKMSAKELLDAAKEKDKASYEAHLKPKTDSSDKNSINSNPEIKDKHKKQKTKKQKRSRLVKEAKVESNAKNF